MLLAGRELSRLKIFQATLDLPLGVRSQSKLAAGSVEDKVFVDGLHVDDDTLGDTADIGEGDGLMDGLIAFGFNVEGIGVARSEVVKKPAASDLAREDGLRVAEKCGREAHVHGDGERLAIFSRDINDDGAVVLAGHDGGHLGECWGGETENEKGGERQL